MPGPVLTSDEIAQIKKEQTKALAAAETYTNQIVAQQARALELAKVDSAFKKFFDYYDTQIVGQYNNERKAINGVYIDSPVLESDIISVASLAGGRLQPSLPQTDIVRVAQFDGTPTLTDPANELQYIQDQANAQNAIMNGYGGTPPAVSVLTSTSINSGSTVLQLTDLTSTFSIAPGSVFVIQNGGDLAVIRILTFVMRVSPVPPPYVADCTIEMIVPPAGTISSGQMLTVFNGFTNPERQIKTASSPQLQPLMDYLILQIQNKVNLRISALALQVTALGLNQDPDGVAAIGIALTSAQNSSTYLTNYLINTNVSNFGIAGLSSEINTRMAFTSTRIVEINAAYTGQTLNYYNERYNAANNRANTSRGSLRLQKNTEQVAATSAQFASTLTDQANAIGSILP